MPIQKTLAAALLTLLLCPWLFASPTAPGLAARSAILMEAHTGAILYELRADEPIPPASLTKLMTLHIALEEIAAGRLDLDREVVPQPEAWAANMPPRSSVMHLGPNQKLTVAELLKGLMVVSGNDAAVQVALLVAGSVPAFALMMNKEASELGLETMHFVEPSGISEQNTVTAREYAFFCRRFIALHPDILKSLLCTMRLTYPLPENVTGGPDQPPVTQASQNVLLGRYEGVDGLKTGYIDESGYNYAATAERGGMRLISVILGVPRQGPVSGSLQRVRDSVALLDYGFDSFTVVRPTYDLPSPTRVWKGSARSVAVVTASEPLVVVPKERAESVKATVTRRAEVVAPVTAGLVLGSIVVTDGTEELGRFPLIAAADVARGGIPRRVLDSVALFFRRLFGKDLAAAS